MVGQKILDVNVDNINHHIVEICDIFNKFHNDIPSPLELKNYQGYVDAYFATETKLLAFGVDFKTIEFTDDASSNISIINQFFTNLSETYKKRSDADIAVETVESTRKRYREKLNIGFLYKFSDGDLKKIQLLINELRDEISDNNIFDSKHRERLLKKLEGLQKELHKTMSSLDKFWGFMGDAGTAIGKFGKDAKPFVDRVSEILQIVWRTQALAEELPSGTLLPLLKEDFELED